MNGRVHRGKERGADSQLEWLNRVFFFFFSCLVHNIINYALTGLGGVYPILILVVHTNSLVLSTRACLSTVDIGYCTQVAVSISSVAV